MSQLPDAFKGHDLTGWVWIESYCCLRRMTVGGDCINIEDRGDGHFRIGDGGNLVCSLTAQGALASADSLAVLHNGGWAPSPIGSDPGWQPIETLPDAMKEEEETFFGFAPIAEGLHVRGVMRFSQEESDFVVVNFGADWDTICNPTHWRPLPAPPEANP